MAKMGKFLPSRGFARLREASRGFILPYMTHLGRWEYPNIWPTTLGLSVDFSDESCVNCSAVTGATKHERPAVKSMESKVKFALVGSKVKSNHLPS